MDESKSVISQLKKVAEDGNALRNHAKGQGRNTTPLEQRSKSLATAALEDRNVVLVAKRNRNFTPDWIAANLGTGTSTHVSARIISEQLNQVGLYAQKTIHCIPLQPHHCREIILLVTSDSGHQLLWRECGTRYAQKFVCGHDQYGPGMCGQATCTIAEHCFTPLSEEALHHNSNAKRLFWIMFVFIGVL
ncbi:hypothetical protein TNCV_4387411 [Trichonephila clavipes]|nr:hypothetical protein TNCV_4387411 [Trichonephila clavipes]